MQPKQNPVVTLTKINLLKEKARKALEKQRRDKPEIRVNPPVVEFGPITPTEQVLIAKRRFRPQWVRKPNMFKKSPEERSAKINQFIELLNRTDVRTDVRFIL